jgi:hypothetical protein
VTESCQGWLPSPEKYHACMVISTRSQILPCSICQPQVVYMPTAITHAHAAMALVRMYWRHTCTAPPHRSSSTSLPPHLLPLTGWERPHTAPFLSVPSCSALQHVWVSKGGVAADLVSKHVLPDSRDVAQPSAQLSRVPTRPWQACTSMRQL